MIYDKVPKTLAHQIASSVETTIARETVKLTGPLAVSAPLPPQDAIHILTTYKHTAKRQAACRREFDEDIKHVTIRGMGLCLTCIRDGKASESSTYCEDHDEESESDLSSDEDD